MQRDSSALEAGDFDLLVIGGGVYGAWTAYDAALRGLRVALVERTDWAAGTSSASSKLIHGGLRYLERLQLRLVATSLGERKRLARLAPHHVRPLRFVIPVYRGAPVGRLRWALGLTLYDGLAGRGQPVPRHERWSVSRLERAFPFLRPGSLRGGFTYGDCQMDDARYVLEIVDGAMAAGGVAVNRIEAESPLRDGQRVIGARVRDTETGARAEVRASVTVDASGPWGWSRAADQPTVGRPSGTRLTKGVHLVMPQLPVNDAFLLLSPVDGRVCFLIPWYGRTLLGTTDTPYAGEPEAVAVDTRDVEYLLSVADAVLGLGWRADDVEASFAGLRVLPDEQGHPSAASREWSLTRPSPGLLVSVGGKYTTARADAARAVDMVMSQLGRRPGERPTDDRPFPWAPDGEFEAWLSRATAAGVTAGLDEVMARTVALRHGTRVGEIHRRIAERSELAERLDPRLPFCRAEVIQAAEREMARSLEDVLRRRLPWLILSRPDPSVVREAGGLVTSALGWSGERRQEEEAAVLREWARIEGADS